MSAAEGEWLGRSFFERDPVDCARELVGMEFRWGNCSGIVVETEAYAEVGDEACHTFFRPSARDFVASHPAGTAYVYLNYGMYWLTNVLVKNPDTGDRGFVLLRALEPRRGQGLMRRRRRKERDRDLCSGPGKLSMALGIHGDHHGTSLVEAEKPGPARRGFFTPDGTGSGTSVSGWKVEADRRIGINRSQELAWRFLVPGNPHVSVALGKAR